MPSASAQDLLVERDAPIRTWLGVGGRADALARPSSIEDLRRCLEIDPNLRVLGDGANLIVDDDGVGGLVVALSEPAMTAVRRDRDTGRVLAMAGANLPRLVLATVRLGLAGLEGLGGIPATVGGAAVMNAGGAFGQIADAIARVHALDRDGRVVAMDQAEIGFGYRRSGLGGLLVTAVEFALTPGDPAALRARLKDVMAYKKSTQPMAEKSAGCVFRNPLLAADLDGIGRGGQRVSAGMIIDRAGLKGLRVGGAEVSHGHANFIVTRPGASARDAIRLMDEVRRRVLHRFGVALEPEVVIWRRDQ